MKKIIRLTESDLHRIVKESVKRILREEMGPGSPGGGFAGGSETPVGTSNAQISSTAAYDKSISKKNDFWDEANDHEDIIRKSFEDKPVGHKG